MTRYTQEYSRSAGVGQTAVAACPVADAAQACDPTASQGIVVDKTAARIRCRVFEE
ncbi:MAG TPA: hypothetical protein PKC59_09555 [Burkholderiaceae bacterium]|nr:hypothetical protein [Burkholderiaceae bacterium]HNB44476.1 hypothetical protein [Burkholderiaceae bacterium]HNG80224.1 hypothetical protein [Burkholderiaceae bacterium]